MSKKKRNQFSIEDREQIVLRVINEGRSFNSLTEEFQTNHILISRLVNNYKLYGIKKSSLKNTIKYAGGFNFKLIREMLDQKSCALMSKQEAQQNSNELKSSKN